MEHAAKVICADDLKLCAEASWSVGCRPRTKSDLANFLSLEDTVAHLRSLGLPEEGVDYVINALNSPPARKVGGAHQRSRVGEIQSFVQSGFRVDPRAATIQFESSSEHDFAICVSAHPSTLFLIDQPTTVFAPWRTPAGRLHSYQHTPDYLVIYRDKVVVYEVKPLEALTALQKESPHLWAYESGQFTYKPPHKYFGELGIVHQVVPAETISWIYSENLRLLASQEISDSERDEESLSLIKKFVSKKQPTSLATIVDKLHLETGTDILRAVCDGHVFVDLQRCSLWDPENMCICITPTDACSVGRAVEALATAAVRGVDVSWLTCNPKHLPLVGIRYAIATGMDPEEFGGVKTFGKRTEQRIKKLYQTHGIRGLYPNWDKCGRKRTFTSEDIEFALAQIRTDRGSSHHDSVPQSYARYKIDVSKAVCDGRALNLVGLSTYYGLWNSRRHNAKDAYGIGGKRRANADSAYGDPSVQKPLCTLPFQVSHSDHCHLPVLCEESERSPQLSSFVCHKHREILAAVIRFESPSVATLGLLMRQCVRKHGYLSRYIYHDCGSDFLSKQFCIAAAELGVSLMRRPPAKAKAGSEIERYHWTIQETAVKGAVGYIPAVKTMRGTSASHQPSNLPKRKLRDLMIDLNIAMAGINDGSAYGDEGVDRIALRLRSEELFGAQGVPCDLDFRFYVCTSPFMKPIKGKTETRGAIRWEDRRYYSPVLIGKSIKVGSLHPRLDPESGGSVMYFFLDGQWHTAICRERLASAGRSIESILMEAAHDHEARGTTASLLPLHEAIEISRRARRANDDASSVDPSSQDQPKPVLAGEHQTERAISTEEDGPSSASELVQPSAPQDDAAAGLPEGGTSSDWEEVGELDVYEGDAQ